MTRKSTRELERELENIGGDHGTVREWVEHYVETSMAEGFDYDVYYGDEEPDHAGEVCVQDDPNDMATVWIPESDVPEWVDPEVDLPA